jgi:hypothetical protein
MRPMSLSSAFSARKFHFGAAALTHAWPSDCRLATVPADLATNQAPSITLPVRVPLCRPEARVAGALATGANDRGFRCIVRDDGTRTGGLPPLVGESYSGGRGGGGPRGTISAGLSVRGDVEPPRVLRPELLVALTLSLDLFDHARDLFDCARNLLV